MMQAVLVTSTAIVMAFARKEAKAAGLTRYNVLTGKCGDWYIVPIDEMGRLI